MGSHIGSHVRAPCHIDHVREIRFPIRCYIFWFIRNIQSLAREVFNCCVGYQRLTWQLSKKYSLFPSVFMLLIRHTHGENSVGYRLRNYLCAHHKANFVCNSCLWGTQTPKFHSNEYMSSNSQLKQRIGFLIRNNSRVKTKQHSYDEAISDSPCLRSVCAISIAQYITFLCRCVIHPNIHGLAHNKYPLQLKHFFWNVNK